MNGCQDDWGHKDDRQVIVVRLMSLQCRHDGCQYDSNPEGYSRRIMSPEVMVVRQTSVGIIIDKMKLLE
jgi:hypothetical protein